jgi:ketosteroid isomerase-like protein
MKFGLLLGRMITAAFFMFSAVTGAQADTARAGALNSSAALNTAERWATVVGQADIAGLNELLHADYVHVHATALVESKAKFIEALQTGARRYDPIKIEDSNVRVFGDSAVISGKFVLRATTRDRVIEGVNRFVLLVIDTPNGLQVATFQATAIPQPK